MNRQRRLITAAAVLLAGLALAWPFRRETADPAIAPAAPLSQPPAIAKQLAPPAPAPDGVAATVIASTSPRESLPSGGVTLPSRGATAVFAADTAGAATASEPAVRDPLAAASPVTPRDAIDRSPAAPSEDELTPPGPRSYVIHNGDTLERIAKRYLGDEGRALEIFDLNRDVLGNPYLLPLGAELTLPTR